MSRRIVIQGGMSCEVSNLAEEVISETRANSRDGLRFDAGQKRFVYEGLDDYYSNNLIRDAERRYGEKLRDHRTEQIKENAKKHGFSIKSQKTEKEGKIKLVLVKRIYGG